LALDVHEQVTAGKLLLQHLVKGLSVARIVAAAIVDRNLTRHDHLCLKTAGKKLESRDTCLSATVIPGKTLVLV
jgi:hypothetical protein